MNFIWNNKFIYWNFVSLIILKVIFSYSGFLTADILSGQPVFSKEEVVSQINVFRSSLGLPQLRENSTLDSAASKKLNDMVREQYFAHYSPAGVSPWKWISESQYDYNYAGENLALGFFKAKDVVAAWIDSPSHRANLTSANYRETGVAVAPANIRGEEGILVVQLFASPLPGKSVAARPIAKTVSSPAPTISSTPLSNLPVSIKTIETKSGSAIVQTAEAPKTLNIPNASQRLSKAITVANGSLILYALLVFLVSAAYLVFRAANKELVIKTALNLAIFTLALIIPVIQGAHPALIF